MAQGVIRLWGTMEDNDILKICQDRNEHILISTSESDTALTLDWLYM